MLRLSDRKWKEFLFPEIFKICGGFYNKKPEENIQGMIPFIGATNTNNGITQFCTVADIEKTSKTGDNNNAPLDKKIFHGNCIAVTNNGSVGYAYFQKHSFSCSHDVNPLYLLERELNEPIAKFLISVIEKQRVCFTYVHKWRPERMKKSKIMLPINTEGKPDYEFMEAYIKERRQIEIDKYIKYCKERLTELGEFVSISPIENKKWEEFLLLEIFDYEKGNQNNMNVMNNGTMPLISAKKFNNGLKAFVCENNKKSFKGNCISYNNDGNGGAGLSYYQPFDFCLDSHCTALKPKKTNSKWTMLGLVVCLNLQQDKYNHGYALNKERIKKFRFMLPVSVTGKPDYTYMEQYAKNIMIEKLKSYLEYAENKEEVM